VALKDRIPKIKVGKGAKASDEETVPSVEPEATGDATPPPALAETPESTRPPEAVETIQDAAPTEVTPPLGAAESLEDAAPTGVTPPPEAAAMPAEPEPRPDAQPEPESGSIAALRRGLPSEDEVRQVNDYMMDKVGYVPRMFQVMNTIVTEPGKTFADFYNAFAQDGALERKHKELMFMSIGVSYCSPHAILHVMPALKAGATMPEVFEAACIGMLASAWVPNGPGMPAAFDYAQRCMEVADKVARGEPWDFIPEPKFDRGIF
jgi:alkylhydroperoxidase/carboxymuconolactone decarboxylase family protein YurZ